MAQSDFLEVIEICKKFPAGNERIMSSAYFSLGSIYLDQGKRAEAG